MLKIYCSLLLAVLISIQGINAQVTATPFPTQEDSEDVIIYYHADEGNRGLMGLGPTSKVYAHTGACLSDGSTWVNAPSWGDNATKYQLQYVDDNLWSLYIGNIREFYGITDPAKTITRLAFVFRTADNSKEGKGEGNSDIFFDLVDSGFQMAMETSPSGEIISPAQTKVKFRVGTTEKASVTLLVNGEEIAKENDTMLLETDYDFPAPGDYTLSVKATNGTETLSLSKNYCYAEDSKEVAYPGGNPQMGPVANPDGSVTFCLGAPLKESVIIVGEWNDYKISNSQIMNYTDVDGLRYFWINIPDLDENKMYGYYFLVDGQIKVSDPYARLILDPWNDKYISTDVFPGLPEYPIEKIQNTPLAIYLGNINDYDWKIKEFNGVEPENLIIYELLFRDFTGSEGQAKGNGTVKQAIEKLPYLIDLGINAIEVLPIMEFQNNISWGYNPNFYFAVDKAYGTPDDYKEFIDLCHQNGIAVILDMVFNQSDGLHPWYQMYPAGQNPFYNLDAPHAYSVLNDWNQGFPMVQQQWADVIRYWMTEYKFDGFRFDLVKGLGNNDSYANNGDEATNAYNESRVKRMEELQKVVKSINPKAYFINENLATAKEENAMAEFGQLNWAAVNYAGCQFAMGYPEGSDLNRLYAVKDDRLWGSTVSYLESHDEQRLAYKQDMWGVNGVKGNVETSMQRLGAAAAQMILAPGAHMIWQFSEMGNAENTKNSSGGNNTDPKIVNWNLLDEPNHYGLYQNYCELIAIRNLNPDLFSEEAEFISNCGEDDWTKGRTMVSTNGTQQLVTVINPNVKGEITVNVPFVLSETTGYGIISKSYNSSPSFNLQNNTVTVPANCYVSIGTHTLASIDEIETSGQKLHVKCGEGYISIENLEGEAVLFSLDGKKIKTFKEEGRVNVAQGLYIVTNGNESVKILVK